MKNVEEKFYIRNESKKNEMARKRRLPDMILGPETSSWPSSWRGCKGRTLMSETIKTEQIHSYLSGMLATDCN